MSDPPNDDDDDDNDSIFAPNLMGNNENKTRKEPQDTI